MENISERIAHLESTVKMMHEDIKEIRRDIKELRNIVNEEIEYLSDRVNQIEKQMISFNILKKVLIFIAGAIASTVIHILFSLVK